MCFIVQWFKSHGCVLWLYFRDSREINRTSSREEENRKEGRMTKNKDCDASFQCRWHENKKPSNIFIKICQHSVFLSFYQVSEFMSAVALKTRQRSTVVSPPISKSFIECCLHVCVGNVQCCGWQSGIRSGSVSVLGCGAADVRRCNNAILCVSLCWPILDLALAEWEGSLEPCFHNVSPHCCSETAKNLYYCNWRLKGYCRWKHQIRIKRQILIYICFNNNCSFIDYKNQYWHRFIFSDHRSALTLWPPA